jgi:hypothetical protein
LRPIVILDTQRHLLEDKLRLFSSFHGAKRLDLQFAEDLGSPFEVALRSFDVGEDLGDASSLDLDEYLRRRH